MLRGKAFGHNVHGKQCLVLRSEFVGASDFVCLAELELIGWATDLSDRNEVAAPGQVTRKLETSKVRSMVFGPNDMLGVAGDEKAAVWDVSGNRIVRSGTGSVVELSPEDAWLTMAKTANGFTVRELESGRELASFPSACGDPYKCLPARRQNDGAMVFTGWGVYSSGNREGRNLSLPNLGVGVVYAANQRRFRDRQQ
jgi:hypothetical protein